MSRYMIAQDDPHLTVTVGWDNPLQTFFASVVDDRIPEGEDDCVLWLGQVEGEVRTVGELYLALMPWVELSVETLRQLTHDRDTSPPQTPLQQQMLRMLKHLRTIP